MRNASCMTISTLVDPVWVMTYRNSLQRCPESVCVIPFLMLFPGPKMTWEFGELGYDFSINRCEDGNVDPNCRLSPKPIRWDYYQQPLRENLYTIFRDVNHLKLDKLQDMRVSFRSLIGDSKSIALKSDSFEIFIVGNFGVTNNGLTTITPSAGRWYDFFTGDSIDLVNNSYAQILEPGEYHIYTSEKVPRHSDYFSHTTEIPRATDFGIDIYPNPVSIGETINIQAHDIKIEQALLMDVLGKVSIATLNTHGDIQVSTQLPGGTYFLLLQTNRGLLGHQLIVSR